MATSLVCEYTPVLLDPANLSISPIQNPAPRGCSSGGDLAAPHDVVPWYALRPVTVPEDLIPRDGVAAALDRAVEVCPVTLVLAPSGFGKSTAVAEWSQRRGGGTAWVTAMPLVDPRPLVMAGLLAGAPAPERDGSAEVLSEFDISGFANWLASYLRHRPSRPTVLVIDDAHVIDPVDLAETIQAAARSLEDGLVRLVLVGQPSLKEATLDLPGSVVTIGPQQLAYTLTELRDRFGAQARRLHSDTGGWPIAVRFSALGRSQGLGESNLIATGMDVFGEYMEQHILSGLPQLLVEAVYDTAVLGKFDQVLAEQVFGSEIGPLLEELVSSGLLLTRTEADGRSGYAWPDLVLEYFGRLGRARDPQRVRAIELRAAQALRGAQPIAAAGHAMRGGDQPLAMEIVCSAWPRLLLSHDVRALDAVCLEVCRGAEVADLLRIRACCQQVRGLYEWAALSLARARELEAADPAEPTFTACITDAFLSTGAASSKSKIARATARLTVAQPVEDTLHGTFLVLSIQVRLRIDPGRTITAITDLEAAATRAGLPNLVWHTQMMRVWAEVHCGRFMDAAATFARLGPATAGTPAEWTMFQRGFSQFWRGIVAYWQGHVAEALELFRALLEDLDCADEIRWLSTIHYANCVVDLRRFDLVGEIESHIAALPGEVRLGVSWHDCKLLLSAYLHAAQGNRRQAKALASVVDPQVLDAPLIILLADSLRQAGDIGSARAVLGRIPAVAPPGDAGLDGVSLAVLNAQLALQEGAVAEATKNLEEALSLAAAENLYQPLLRQSAQIDGPLRAISRSGSPAAAAAAHIVRTRGCIAARANAAELTAREVEVLSALAVASTLREIADEFDISINTVKTHTRAIYRKLGVSNRREAVRTAWKRTR